MGSLHSTLPWDPFQDPETQRARLLAATKGASPSTSSSSLASASTNTGNGFGTSGHHHHHSSVLLMGSDAPPLYEHALVGDWESLLRRIVTHPKEAAYKDKCKNMPLHISCRRQPPPEVVEALLKANPEALTSKTVDGLTPLHFCCFCGSEPETIELVMWLGVEYYNNNSSSGSSNDQDSHQLKIYDDSQAPHSLRELVDRRGRTPLHCVCAGFRSAHRLKVVKKLLDLDPSCAMARDERGRTPLSLIVDDYAEELQDALKRTTTVEEAKTKCLERSGDLYECFQVSSMLLRAAYTGTIQEDKPLSTNEIQVQGPFRLLHAAVGVGGCPSVLIRLILKIDAEAITKRDGDLNLPLHVACKTIGQPWSRKIITKSGALGSVVYNADFGRGKAQGNNKQQLNGGSNHGKTSKSDDDDVTQELLEAYPEAASVKDELGKVPFVLAVESGKPWKTTLHPLWQEHELEEESYQLLEEALDQALTSFSPKLRKQTVNTLGHLAPRWPKDKLSDWTVHMIEFARDCGGLNSNNSDHASVHSQKQRDDDELWAALQSSTLEGLASLLSSRSTILQEIDEQDRSDAPQQALDVALPLLSHQDEPVRIGAAKVVGASVRLLGVEATDRAFRDIIFPEDDGGSQDESSSLSTIGHSIVINEESPEVLHGRAMAGRYILLRGFQVLNEYQNNCVKQWIKHESPLVRKAGCLVVGSLLRSVMELKDFKSVLLKCMRPMEEANVHLALAQALSQAAREHTNLFLCKAGLPLLDGALMLSSSRITPPHVQHAFHVFLWHALQQQEGGLQEYMKMAEGENGTIMMSLITKRLAKLPVVEEGDEEGDS